MHEVSWPRTERRRRDGCLSCVIVGACREAYLEEIDKLQRKKFDIDQSPARCANACGQSFKISHHRMRRTDIEKNTNLPCIKTPVYATNSKYASKINQSSIATVAFTFTLAHARSTIATVANANMTADTLTAVWPDGRSPLPFFGSCNCGSGAICGEDSRPKTCTRLRTRHG